MTCVHVGLRAPFASAHCCHKHYTVQGCFSSVVCHLVLFFRAAAAIASYTCEARRAIDFSLLCTLNEAIKVTDLGRVGHASDVHTFHMRCVSNSSIKQQLDLQTVAITFVTLQHFRSTTVHSSALVNSNDLRRRAGCRFCAVCLRHVSVGRCILHIACAIGLHL